MIQFSSGSPSALKAARRLLGLNFFGAEEWAGLYPRLLPSAGLTTIPPFPWEPALLEGECPFQSGRAIYQTHLAFLGMSAAGGWPLTLWRWKRLRPALFNARAHLWYAPYAFARHIPCQNRWYLMPVAGLLGPGARTYIEHAALLPPQYTVPHAIEEATKLLLYHGLNGSFPPLPYTWSWCRESTQRDGERRQVALSVAGMKRLKVGAFPPVELRDSLRLAASRSPSTLP